MLPQVGWGRSGFQGGLSGIVGGTLHLLLPQCLLGSSTEDLLCVHMRPRGRGSCVGPGTRRPAVSNRASFPAAL